VLVAVWSVFSVAGVRLAPEMDELLRMSHLHSSSGQHVGDVMASKRWTTHDVALSLPPSANHMPQFNGRSKHSMPQFTGFSRVLSINCLLESFGIQCFDAVG